MSEYRFYVDAYTPENLPMATLARYLEDLAILLGHQESVHFRRLEPGSTVIVQFVEEAAAPEVRHRLEEIRLKNAPADALKAFESIDKRLENDLAIGYLEEVGGGKVIEFPGRVRREKLDFGGVTQKESIDGVPIRVGGQDEWVPILLEAQNGDVISGAYAKRAVARQIAVHLFTDVIRVHGRGRYHRTPEGMWLLERFSITDFEVLDSSPLREVVDRLRTIEGSEWPEVDDPLEELSRLRRG